MGEPCAPHLALGKTGETIAADYLRKQKYKIYKTNDQLSYDEVDNIAFDKQEKTLVFVEVKTRKKNYGYSPLMNLTYSKKKKLFRSMRRWISENEYEESTRVDVICVCENKVTQHLKGITMGDQSVY